MGGEVKKNEDEEIDPEVLKRREAIRNRNLEQLQEEHIQKCMHIDWRIGPVRIYLNPLVTVASAIIIWCFVAYCISDPKDSKEKLASVKTWVTDKWTWLYVGTQDVWAFFIVILYFSKYSNMKLGKEDEEPEYSDGSYFTMLFSAGIGIGLFYYGVAEPVFHYSPGKYGNRYWGRYNDNQRAQDAINLTFFHWGIHGWVVYVIIGLLLGFLCYRRGLPMTMRTCFYPILREKIFGITGDLIDILCIICTMFGVCTSLGLGVIQLNNGIHRINSDIAESTNNQTIIIWCVTALATISVISGIKLGIRRLSEICFGIGCLIMFIIFFAGNTWHILNLLVQSIGYYFQWLLQLGFHTDAFAQLGIAPDGKEKENWMDAWTIFYWGWWISWSPFVGMFIAKISRGRTIKDFILYTLTLPCVYSFFWFSIFGGTGIEMENLAKNKGVNCSMYKEPVYNTKKYDTKQEEIFGLYGGVTLLSCRKDTEMWFDVMNNYGDIGMFLSVLSLIAIILYFVTSSDSGSLVIDCLSANGHSDPPIAQRIFWALTEGATATALLQAGGKDALAALQSVSVACGLPFTFCLNWTCIAMWRAVREEAGEIEECWGRWHKSMFALGSQRRAMKCLVSLFCPWYLHAKTRAKMEDDNSFRSFIINSLSIAVPFYLWVILMLCELGVDSISYVGWAIAMMYVAVSSGLRGEIRRKYDIEGDMIEDWFALMLVYPLSITQMSEQVEYGELPVDKKLDSIEMGELNGGQANGNHGMSRETEKV